MKKYEELGYNGLENKPKGRPKSMSRKPKEETKTIKDNTPLTNEEREELIRLRKEKEYLEMENEILKKLDALVQMRLKQQEKKK
jgi:transposase